MTNSTDKFPGLLESPGTYRKGSDDFGVTFAVPASSVQHIQPLMQKAGRFFIVRLVQAESSEEIERLMQDDLPREIIPGSAIVIPAEETVTVDVAADWLCMTERNVQILADKGIVHKDAWGKYRLKESVQSYIREMHQRADGKNSDYNRERTEAMRMKRQQAEVEYLEKVGALVNANMVRRAIEQGLSQHRQRWVMMAKFLAPRLEGLTVQEIEATLDDYSRSSLTALADLEVPGAGGPGGAPGDVPAAPPHGERVGRRKKKALKQDKR